MCSKAVGLRQINWTRNAYLDILLHDFQAFKRIPQSGGLRRSIIQDFASLSGFGGRCFVRYSWEEIVGLGQHT
jgi:hypothetical protein